jgi:PAS domain S-box-containing protein
VIKTRHKVIALSIGLGLSLWVIDAWLDHIFFYDASFFDLLIANVPQHELYIRLAGFGLFVAFGVIAARLIAARNRAWQQVAHLNSFLRAIRNVNQLIVREKDRHALLQKACDILIETRDLYNIWIVLLDDQAGHLAAQAGLDEAQLSKIQAHIASGQWTQCMRTTLKERKLYTAAHPAAECADCPLSDEYVERGAAALCLEYTNRVYGALVVSLPRHRLNDAQEIDLLHELSLDIALALNNLEWENEHRRTEAALERSERQLRKAQQIGRVGSWEFDLNTQMVYASDQARHIYGLASDEWTIERVQHVPLPEYRPMLDRALADLVAGRAPYDVEFRIERPTDHAIVYIHSLAEYDAERKTVIGTIQDVTQQKNTQRALQEYSEHLKDMVEARTRDLKEAHQRLLRQERLAALGELAGSVGHELRNPLGVIGNTVYYLKLIQTGAEQKVLDCLDLIERQIDRATKIIEDLLRMRHEPVAAQQNALVTDIVDRALAESEIPEHIQLSTEIASTLQAFVDPQQIEQVLVNLIANACQAMLDPGHLTIVARADDGLVELSISDTGCGIAPEHMDRLFEPLFTTKARGIGLGLALSRNLVRANQGSIHVESAPGEGTTFTLSLPRSQNG